MFQSRPLQNNLLTPPEPLRSLLKCVSELSIQKIEGGALTQQILTPPVRVAPKAFVLPSIQLFQPGLCIHEYPQLWIREATGAQSEMWDPSPSGYTRVKLVKAHAHCSLYQWQK